MTHKELVDQYIDIKNDWKGELMYLRSIMRETDLEETLKWGAPVYCKNGKNIVGISSFKEYVGLWFFQGGYLKDEQKVLMNAQEGKTKAMRQWRFTTISELIANKKLILSYIQETIANHDKGIFLKPKRKTKPLIIPKELQNALDSHSNLKDKFEALTVSSRREYAEYISEAKRDSTKVRRLEKITALILEGKGLNDKYKK